MVSSPSFAEMRKRNTADIVRFIRTTPGVSRADLARQACLAKATVSAIVDDLLGQEVLAEVGLKSSGGGRPATGLSFNPSYSYVFGVSLDEMESTACLLDLDGNVVKEFRKSLRVGWTAESVGKFLLERLKATLVQMKRNECSVSCIGVGLPGPIQVPNVDIVSGQYGKVLQMLKEYLHCPVVIDSNTNVAAIAELCDVPTGEGQLALVVRVGHRVRSALVARGEILSGSEGLAGEFNHLTLPTHRSRCSCGELGCINAIGSVGGMLSRSQAAGLDANDFDEFLKQCNFGNKTALKILTEAGEAVGHALGIAIDLLAPHLVVISGAPVSAGELMLRPLRESIKKSSGVAVLRNIRVVAGREDERAESYGAGLRAIKALGDLSSIVKFPHRQ